MLTSNNKATSRISAGHMSLLLTEPAISVMHVHPYQSEFFVYISKYSKMFLSI